MNLPSHKLLTVEKHFYYSFLAGLCAASGSIFGKISSCEIGFINDIVIQYIVSAVFIIFMLICNAAVWTFFVKSLQETNSSFISTLGVAAVNYIFSALVGWLVFGEALSAMWCLGTLLILSGLALIASDSQEASVDKTS